jgi:hypothetical protein
MLTFEEWLLGGNQFQRSSFGPNPQPEPNPQQEPHPEPEPNPQPELNPLPEPNPEFAIFVITTSSKWCGPTTWLDIRSHKMAASQELHADCNSPDSHLMSHCFSQICGDAALQQYSAKRGKQAHEMNPKVSWNTFHATLN